VPGLGDSITTGREWVLARIPGLGLKPLLGVRGINVFENLARLEVVIETWILAPSREERADRRVAFLREVAPQLERAMRFLERLAIEPDAES
tara:strand:+ start:2706 stop:2981 length:276 start_codon:yes stop_codon:yes gene_type:complete